MPLWKAEKGRSRLDLRVVTQCTTRGMSRQRSLHKFWLLEVGHTNGPNDLWLTTWLVGTSRVPYLQNNGFWCWGLRVEWRVVKWTMTRPAHSWLEFQRLGFHQVSRLTHDSSRRVVARHTSRQSTRQGHFSPLEFWLSVEGSTSHLHDFSGSPRLVRGVVRAGQ